MRDGWEAEAGKWAAFARTPGHDSMYDEINLPALRALLPGPGRATLDLGCGEGRVGRACARVHPPGVSAVATLAAAALTPSMNRPMPNR
jgi:precorrin-6B methylase 2